MCGPHHCLGRDAFASGPEILRRLLQLRQNASVLEQGCAGHSPNSANRKHQITRHPWRTSPPLRPNLGFRYTQDLLGLWLAVIAFSALPPPASVSTRRWRARRRMAKGFLASACAPDFLRPDADRWLARMFDRLTQVGDEDGAINGGQTLLLAGLLCLALRREDSDLGRQVGAVVRAQGLKASSALRQLANNVDR